MNIRPGSDRAGFDLKEEISERGFIVKTELARIFYVHSEAGSHKVHLLETAGWCCVGERQEDIGNRL